MLMRVCNACRYIPWVPAYTFEDLYKTNHDHYYQNRYLGADDHKTNQQVYLIISY